MRVCAWTVVLLCALLPARADTIFGSLLDGDILAIDTEHLTTAVLAHTGRCWYDIAFAPDGRLYGSDMYSLYRIDVASGHASLMGSFGFFVNGLTFIGNTLYASGATALYTVDLASGHTHLIGSTGYTSSGDLAWFQGAMYLSGAGLPSDLLVRVDPLTGHGTLLGEVGMPGVYGLAATPSRLLALTVSGEVLELDVTTGKGTQVGSIPGPFYGASTRPGVPMPTDIPEPASLVLLGSGAAIALNLRRH